VVTDWDEQFRKKLTLRAKMIKQILWQRSGGYWMLYSGLIYLAVGMYCIFVDNFVPVWLAQIVWISMLCLPFAIPPLGRWLNMRIDWDIKMFDFFRRKTAQEFVDDASNVYNLPKPKAVPPTPAVTPPKEEPAKIFYRLGLTDNNRVAFSMGYSEITMNHAGCQQMIDQLVFFQSQLYDETDGPEDDPDGGEPVPVPEQKAA
jgi:hypothetical protein